ncbi:MAG: class I SAM-dependent methyltransferase [Sedimentibacter sp.]|uniref:tRNA (adenine(22)-N(1))-methyltransferase n=1 Tax=Sedimentibacter sp. TaxID=1960295 RepID=UPI002980D4DE|nr:class I SAM-dependent methyltransferase [Sedimentibacter sp.]MDW5300337.1 class I SAM-dependent methyltransferase [Sedimentibacter sp.]
MNRLECIKSMVTKCNTVADIGTDHGYVAEMMLNDNICEHVIATDLNEGPLNRAIEYLTIKNLNLKCDFRLGYGLMVLKKKEADAIVIAGMGGELIADILEVSKNISKESSQLILQPMTTAEKLRRYLCENGFKIIDEKIIKEYHHYYFVIKATPGSAEITDEIYYEFSRHLIEKKEPLMMEYINKVLNINEKIINSLEKTNNKEYNEKINCLKQKNNRVRELMSN